MNRDTPSWLLKQGELYDALNIIFDRPGVARQRGPSTALSALGAVSAFCTILGFCYSQDGTAIEELYGANGKDGIVTSINKTTGAFLNLTPGAITAGSVLGRPVRHFGYVHFPHVVTATGLRKSLVLAGQVTGTAFTNGVVAQCTANNQQITLTGVDVTTNIRVGQLIHILNAVGATRDHTCRVVSVDTTKLFTVWPMPPFTDAAIGVGNLLGGVSGVLPAGICAASFQNRLVFGNCNDMASVGQTLIADRRIYYSPLITETATFGGQTLSGTIFNNPAAWPALNFIDIPGADPIIAMEPVSDNELLILTSTHPVVFRGNLVTQAATTVPQVTFDISDINQPFGCLSDLSVHRTPRGIVWAGPNGIYAYTGGGHIDELTKGKISTFWRSLVRGSSFAIHGATYVRGHYVISGTSGGSTFALCCNMDTLAWSRFTGTGTDIFFGVARPTDASQVFVARWWDTTGAAPTHTNGQVIRIESFFDPYTAGTAKLDSDSTAVAFSITSRVLDGDSETQKIQSRMTVRYQSACTGTTGSTTLTAQSRIDAAEITSQAVRTLGTLSSTEPRTISAATNATPVVCTTSVVHNYQTDDYVDINGATGMPGINGRWRITVLSTTTFSLNGSSASTAYTASSASVKKLTESDYQTNTLDQGQGVSFTIFSTNVINNFELHGLRVAYYERAAPVMSA